MTRLAAPLLAAFLLAGCVRPPAAQIWLTTADETKKLSAEPAQAATGPAKGDEAVTIDTTKHFQKMHGFGAAMTDASAQVLSALPDDKRKAIMCL